MLTYNDIIDTLAEDPLLAQRLATRTDRPVRVWESDEGLHVRETGNPSQYLLTVTVQENTADHRP